MFFLPGFKKAFAEKYGTFYQMWSAPHDSDQFKLFSVTIWQRCFSLILQFFFICPLQYHSIFVPSVVRFDIYGRKRRGETEEPTLPPSLQQQGGQMLTLSLVSHSTGNVKRFKERRLATWHMTVPI
jgi:hypothetical protein